MSGLITVFARHRVSANVLTLVFLLSGGFAISRLTVRFFPSFETNTIVVAAVNSGATASDIEESVIVPLENALRSVPDFTDLYSYSRANTGSVILEFPDSVDLSKALEEVKSEIDRVTLPSNVEKPVVFIAEFEEPIANLILVGDNLGELRGLARSLENSLNTLNIGQVSVSGLPEEVIRARVAQHKIVELDMTIEQIGRAVGAQNSDSSIGSISNLGNRRNLRTASKTSNLRALSAIPVRATADGSIVTLGEIADLERGLVEDQVAIKYRGRHAVQFKLINSANQDILEAADKLYVWLDKTRSQLPTSVELLTIGEKWRLVQSRLRLLVENGLMGMILVVAVLFLFLSGPVAIWVALAIPVAIMGALFLFELVGGTINMISMFALIMAVGLIVDDSIVVGENAQHRLRNGIPPLRAVTSAARQMFTPVFASSFTTVAAFLPLFLISGPIGGIIFDIPLIIVCILTIAMIECFLILPGHLYQSFTTRTRRKPSYLRQRLDEYFDTFREQFFRPLARIAVRYRVATVSGGAMFLVLAVGLLNFGLVNYRFFPGAEGNNLSATIKLVSGSDRQDVVAYVEKAIGDLNETDEELGGGLVRHVVALIGKGPASDPAADEQAIVSIELVPAEDRSVSVDQVAKSWRKRIESDRWPGVERLEVRGESSGPPGRDIEVRLTAPSVAQIKKFSHLVQETLASIPGVSSISDDTPYGKEEIIFSLTPLGRSLNLDVATIARQLNNAVEGFKVQTFTEGVDEIEFRVLLDGEVGDLIDGFYVRLPNGSFAPLRDLVTWRSAQSFESIQHKFGNPAVVVFADLDVAATTTVRAVLTQLEDGVLRDLSQNYGISYSFAGKNTDEQQTAKEMKTGMIIAVTLIYIILTWVFNSWTVPLAVMVTMPLGVVGAVAGHWIMGISMSILSFFGVFTLMGIIVNDSIVLVRSFQDLREETSDAQVNDELIVEAACQRLRAVVLTSLTTIGGLLPLMFETSLQAQFLIPMAVSICFGLAFATVLILFFTPACLSLHGAIANWWQRLRKRSRQIASLRHVPDTL